jgi:hypothetical protein
VKEFSFSNITLKDLKSVIKIKQIYDLSYFNNWFKDREIGKQDLEFLKKMNLRYGENFANILKYFSEDRLKAKFIIPIINQVNFFIPEKNISDFYHEKLQYSNNEFSFNGFCDFIVAQGLEEAETPLFFIQEFKRGDNFSRPEPQLLAEMISGLELNKNNRFFGAIITGVFWNFVILWKDKKSYKYVVSQNFDSTKFNDLKKIFQNLLFVKEEILNLVKFEKGKENEAQGYY